jgi:hypothetical protein
MRWYQIKKLLHIKGNNFQSEVTTHKMEEKSLPAIIKDLARLYKVLNH